MKYLNRLLDKARGWLSTPAPPPLATQAVVQDRFGRALFDELLDEAPALADLVTRLNVKYDYTHDLVSDTFAQLYQAAPRLRSTDEMALTHLINHAVAVSLSAAPEVVEARPFTQHDKYGAAMATISVGEKVREYLQEHKDVQKQAEQARKAEEAREQAGDALSQALGTVEQWQDELAQAMGDFDGNGPLTEQQAVAQAALDAAAGDLKKALSKAERAQAKATSAAEQAQQAAATARSQLRQPVREGVQQAVEQLASEEELFRAWGISPGDVSRMSFEERQRRARQLRGHRLSKFVKELGRWRLMGVAQRAKKVVHGRDEVYDTHVSGHLPDVLAGEFVSLAIPSLRPDFVVRLTEGRLLSKKFRGTENTGKGAIIAVVDTSGSMEGKDKAGITRECWAKGLALAMLDQARAERRDYVGIIFSSRHQQQVFRFPKGEGSLDDVLTYTAKMFGGGTDFERPLDLAVEVLEQEFNREGRAKGDIILITDDECGVSPAWMKRYQASKERLGFRTFGIAVGMTRPGSTLTALSDNVRAVTEFVDPAVAADLIRTV